ncbi:MAG: TIGR01548 family HAD-type hydrolase [Synechococcus sp. SB0668_bin_15]|nr:TIGR01548 family HAD-type hydrolase [Synechococcus sp. SB0668_bin_15]MXZ83402.1 TIGR01548 family HAD-type hydrolase [Synechococcus sp. SB0666_bin_14]MYC50457.1 TIGR01548 family HAD-type hydrolase [Synechococcus sp. SB0662_bin_14]MYG46898.1 TIGR01548 family HAD-type hydrolase [Synechococcus sp. SB0675_bin_6]MYJ59439.1 TIGR01548 family HAD-type hydrolase [Synechococcus sp. SB0672_bin_6]MYK90795.1 TIGR01548 family HAD-type hydrolase [Synechococcus sp. SB0669_bin_8]
MLLFDIDGVIRDVGRSYRLAVTETVAHFSGWRPTPETIDALKAEGRWNNDWDASLELLRRRQYQQPSLPLPSREAVVEVFSGLYFGREDGGAVSQEPHRWTGLIRQEPLLVDGAFFAALSEAGIGWGVVSGAEPSSARHVLMERLGLPDPPLVAMGDAPDKPDPTGLLQLAEELAATSRTPLSHLPMGYVGDTVADVLTVIHARRQQPRLRCKALGVAPPHVAAAGAAVRSAYHQQLLAAGADAVIGATAELRPERVFQLLQVGDS